MQGWQVHKYGGHDQFKFSSDIPIPKIKRATEILVEVVTTSVNALDELMIGS